MAGNFPGFLFSDRQIIQNNVINSPKIKRYAMFCKKSILFIFICYVSFSSILVYPNSSTNNSLETKDNTITLNKETLKVRQFGDQILHTAPKPVTLNEISKVESFIAIMKKIQKDYGGVGIACNQCNDIKDPLQIILIGSSDLTTREKAQKRYPTENIPHLFVMINPQIIEYSQEVYYPSHGEGCLSVCGAIRGKVQRHKSIKVKYYNLDGMLITEEYSGFAAHIIQHEYDHLRGIVYLQKILKYCSIKNKNKIIDLINNRISSDLVTTLKIDDPKMIFDIDNEIIIDFKELSNCLNEMPISTILGIKKMLQLSEPLNLANTD